MAPKHWRLRRELVEAFPTPSPPIDGTPQTASPPSAKAPLSQPTPSIPRGAPVGRVADAMGPVLDKAWQLTDASLRDTDDAQAVPLSAGPRVSNHFHVSVALAGDGPAPRDAQELETALVALLRDAARRQGLDV